MVVSSPHHTHTPHPLWRADGIRLPGEEGGDGDYGRGKARTQLSTSAFGQNPPRKPSPSPSSLAADSYHVLGWLEAQGGQIKNTD